MLDTHLSPVAATLMLVQGQSGPGLSWAVVYHSADMQGALGVAFAVFIRRLPCRQGQESSVNIYPPQFAAFKLDESPAALWDRCCVPSWSHWGRRAIEGPACCLVYDLGGLLDLSEPHLRMVW